jgi:antitoxin HigA-1
MGKLPTNRPPTPPGEMLREEFLSPMQIDEQQLAESIHVPYQYIKEIIADQKSITPSIALRLAKFFDMSPDFWMNLQMRWDLYQTQQAESETSTRSVHTSLLESLRRVKLIVPLGTKYL